MMPQAIVCARRKHFGYYAVCVIDIRKASPVIVAALIGHDAQIAAPTLQKFRHRETASKRVENARAARQCLDHGAQLVPPSQLVSNKWQWGLLQVKL
jgi:hypothetical protein